MQKKTPYNACRHQGVRNKTDQDLVSVYNKLYVHHKNKKKESQSIKATFSAKNATFNADLQLLVQKMYTLSLTLTFAPFFIY